MPTSLSMAAVVPLPAEDHHGVVVAVDRAVDLGAGVLAQPGGLQPGAAALGVGVGVAGEHLVADEVLDEAEGAAAGGVVGVGHPARAERPVHQLVVADHRLPDPPQDRRVLELPGRAAGWRTSPHAPAPMGGPYVCGLPRAVPRADPAVGVGEHLDGVAVAEPLLLRRPSGRWRVRRGRSRRRATPPARSRPGGRPRPRGAPSPNRSAISRPVSPPGMPLVEVARQPAARRSPGTGPPRGARRDGRRRRTRAARAAW